MIDAIIYTSNSNKYTRKIISEDLNAVMVINDNNKSEIFYKKNILYIKRINNDDTAKQSKEIDFLEYNKNKNIEVILVNNEQITGKLINYLLDKIIIIDNKNIRYDIFKSNIICIKEL